MHNMFVCILSTIQSFCTRFTLKPTYRGRSVGRRCVVASVRRALITRWITDPHGSAPARALKFWEAVLFRSRGRCGRTNRLSRRAASWTPSRRRSASTRRWWKPEKLKMLWEWMEKSEGSLVPVLEMKARQICISQHNRICWESWVFSSFMCKSFTFYFSTCKSFTKRQFA